MTKDELFQLYGRVQKKDRAAEDQLRKLHRQTFPRSSLNKEGRGSSSDYRTNLHTMYNHLYRGLKK